MSRISVVYRYDHAEDVVYREGRGCSDRSFEPAKCHATLQHAVEAVEEYERSEARVQHLLLGAEQYEEIVAYLAYERGVNSQIQLGDSVGDGQDDVHKLVEDVIGVDTIVTSDSQIESVGAPVSVLFQSLRENNAE